MILGYVVDAGYEATGVAKFALLEPAVELGSLEQIFVLMSFDTDTDTSTNIGTNTGTNMGTNTGTDTGTNTGTDTGADTGTGAGTDTGAASE